MTDYPVSIDDVVALGLSPNADGQADCPVGIVRLRTPDGVTLDLYSFMDGTFGYDRRFIAWRRIDEIRWAFVDPERESACLSYDRDRDAYFDMSAVARFQSSWTSRTHLVPPRPTSSRTT